MKRIAAAALLAAASLAAHAVVFTSDYDRLAALPPVPPGGDVDWRTKGVVTPVKNQGSCDASWAFGVTGLVEATHAIADGVLSNLSEQSLVDCTGAPSGCDGGSPVDALRALVGDGGLPGQSSYPYTARDGACKAFTPIATIPGAGRIPPGDEASMLGYLARGPILALIGEGPALDAYHGGVFTGPCGTTPTRAVLVVGRQTQGNGAVWIVKNSLGASWGAQGYVAIAAGQNLCGIANYAVAVSDDPLPQPAFAIPASGGWTLGALALGVAAVFLVSARRVQ